MASNKKVITVFGATGIQGGSVVDIFLNDPTLSANWQVRGVTRDTTKETSRQLTARGVEVVAADVHDKKSVAAAMAGSHTVFAVTNYWDSSILSKEKDIAVGKNMADAAKEAGVEHYIWSSLKNVTKRITDQFITPAANLFTMANDIHLVVSGGVLSNVQHFDSKAEVEEYIRAQDMPATFFLPGFYMSNFTKDMLSNKNPLGIWMLAMPVPPSALVPVFATKEDTGKFVKAIVENREVLLGKQVLGATSYMELSEVLASFKKTFPGVGATATYLEIPKDAYIDMLTELGMPAPWEMYENMRLLKDFGYYGGESLEPSHQIVTEKLTTWEEFMRKTEPFASLK